MSARGGIDDPLDGPLARDIAAVLDPMRGIVSIRPRRDGVAAFTQLYVAVTEAVGRGLAETDARRSSATVGGAARRAGGAPTASRAGTASGPRKPPRRVAGRGGRTAS